MKLRRLQGSHDLLSATDWAFELFKNGARIIFVHFSAHEALPLRAWAADLMALRIRR